MHWLQSAAAAMRSVVSEEPDAELQPPPAEAEPELEALAGDEIPGLEVEVVPGRQCALSGVRNVVRVMLRIRSPEGVVDPDQQKRPPVTVAAVLDISTSMTGQKLDYAKRAILKLVKHLTPGDTLHFVTYGSEAHVVFRDGDLSEAGKEGLRAQVRAVRVHGCTNLVAGMETAVNLSTGGASAAGAAVRRIFVFSDGQVNVGITEHDEIRRHVARWAAAGITTSSFGIGLDFDEPLMRGLAESGKGRYFYLSEGRDIPRLVSKAVHDLLDLYGTEAMLDVRGASYSVVSRLYGGSGEDDLDAGDAAALSSPGLLSLGDLHGGSRRMVLLELEVTPPGRSEGPFVAAEWSLTFQRGGAPAQCSGQLELTATSDRAALADEAISVRSAFAIRQAADADAEVALHLAHQDRNQAIEVKERQLALLRAALEAAGSEGAAEVDALRQVLERAERVAEQLQREKSLEAVRRQCVQERELNRAMSECGWHNRANSSAGSDPDVACMADLHGVDTPPGSPRGSPPGTPPGRSGTPPLALPGRWPHGAAIFRHDVDSPLTSPGGTPRSPGSPGGTPHSLGSPPLLRQGSADSSDSG